MRASGVLLAMAVATAASPLLAQASSHTHGPVMIAPPPPPPPPAPPADQASQMAMGSTGTIASDAGGMGVRAYPTCGRTLTDRCVERAVAPRRSTTLVPR